MCEGARLFSSFSLWVDKGTPRCGNNFWSDFLCSIALVVKVFNIRKCSCYLTGTCSKKWEVTYSLLDGMNRLAAFIQLCKAWLTCIHSPSTMVVSHRLPKKQEADSLDGEGGFKSLLWVPAGRGERQMVSLHSASSVLNWVAMIML